MRLTTIHWNDRETLSLVLQDGLVPLPLLTQTIQADWSSSMDDLLKSGQLDELTHWYNQDGKKMIAGGAFDQLLLPEHHLEYAPLYRSPGKIWGIGLNYTTHANDLYAQPPDKYPGSFMKPATTIIGHGNYIKIPFLSRRTTAEAELGIIIGRKCRNIKPDRWLDYVAGYTCVIDMTAEDILKMNVRYLTLSKSFDSFFSFGPVFVTADEIPDLQSLRVETVKNGKVIASARVSDMNFSPEVLISFHSEVMTLVPGDIISTGTPGATMIEEGDTVECRITGFPVLTNKVIDLKKG
jgi:2-keto-4-pentenoate hydratase/2-oxohepta-3-ene-1,7-dioic acid hydratase in catechol pathway